MKYSLQDLDKGYLDTKWGRVTVKFSDCLKHDALGFYLKFDEPEEDVILLDVNLRKDMRILSSVVNHELSHLRLGRFIDSHRSSLGKIVDFIDMHHIIGLDYPSLYELCGFSGIVFFALASAFALSSSRFWLPSILLAVFGGILLYLHIHPLYRLTGSFRFSFNHRRVRNDS